MGSTAAAVPKKTGAMGALSGLGNLVSAINPIAGGINSIFQMIAPLFAKDWDKINATKMQQDLEAWARSIQQQVDSGQMEVEDAIPYLDTIMAQATMISGLGGGDTQAYGGAGANLAAMVGQIRANVMSKLGNKYTTPPGDSAFRDRIKPQEGKGVLGTALINAVLGSELGKSWMRQSPLMGKAFGEFKDPMTQLGDVRNSLGEMGLGRWNDPTSYDSKGIGDLLRSFLPKFDPDKKMGYPNLDDMLPGATEKYNKPIEKSDYPALDEILPGAEEKYNDFDPKSKTPYPKIEDIGPPPPKIGPDEPEEPGPGPTPPGPGPYIPNPGPGRPTVPAGTPEVGSSISTRGIAATSHGLYPASRTPAQLPGETYEEFLQRTGPSRASPGRVLSGGLSRNSGR